MSHLIEKYPNSNAVDALKSVVCALDALVAQISKEKCVVWMKDAPQHEAIDALDLAVRDFWRHDDQDDPRTTPVHPGIVAASQVVLDAAHEVNRSKERLAQALKQLPTRERACFMQEDRAKDTNKQLREDMRRIGFGRLSVKAACRQLVVVDEPVVRLGFTWSTGSKSHKRLSVAKAREMIQERFGENNKHLHSLEGLKGSEILVLIQQQAPMLRANIVMDSGKRLTRRAVLPVFVANDKLPAHNQPSPQPPRGAQGRLGRSDLKLEPHPTVPALRLYRYQLPESQ